MGICHTARITDEAIVAARIVDILLSGHDHDLVVQYDGRSLLAESSFDARYVTAIDVAVTVKGAGKARTLSWHPTFRIHDTADITPDPETLALTQRLEARLAKELDVPVGTISTPLDSRISTVRLREGSFGNLVGDALRAATGAEIALTNGGGIRGNRLYPAGTVLTRRDILTELPFGNTTVLVSLTGAQVRTLLESALADLGRPAGRFRRSRVSSSRWIRGRMRDTGFSPSSWTDSPSTRRGPIRWPPTTSSTMAATATASSRMGAP